MHTRITARRFDVNDGLRAHIDSSMGKLDRYFDGIHDAHVILDGHDARDGKSAEITVTVRRQQLRAQQVATSHQEAISGCVRQLRRQVLRYKDKLRDHGQEWHR